MDKEGVVEGYLSAAEAAERLRVSLPTLYAYVSRGLIHSETADASRRTRRYLAEDVERLRQRREQRRDPQKVVDEALHWGAPMLESALTLIEGGKLCYRGVDALKLAQERSVEEVAALLWTGETAQAAALFDASEMRPPSDRVFMPDRTPIERIGALLPLLPNEDLSSYDLRPEAVARTGAALLRLMSAVAVGRTEGGPDVATTLQRAWASHDPDARSLISLALILCADHELNVSSFTARCVASAGSTPYAVVSAGLAALQGVRHGGMTERVAALLREVGAPDRAAATLAARIRRGEAIPGFGHRLYPEGDPRGRLLLERAAVVYPDAPAVALARAAADAGQQVLKEHPNLDFGLVTLCLAAGLPSDAPLTLFALGRTIGWIAHAIEEYATGRLIRPRAHYIGPTPLESNL